MFAHKFPTIFQAIGQSNHKAIPTLCQILQILPAVETVSHLHQCRILIHLSSFLDKNVLIGSVQQIIYSVDMQQTVMLLTIASGIIGIHILRISKDLEIRAVCRKQPVTFVKTLLDRKSVGRERVC